MSAFSNRDAEIREIERLSHLQTLMDQEASRLQPALKEYDNVFAHPAVKSAQTLSVLTNTLAEKAKLIKEDSSRLKDTERELTILSNRGTTIFKDLESQVSRRDSLFSEIEQVTAQLNGLVINKTSFQENAKAVKQAVRSEARQFSTIATKTHTVIKEQVALLGERKSKKEKVASRVNNKIQNSKSLQTSLGESKSKMAAKEEELEKERAALEEKEKKVVGLKQFLSAVSRDEGQLVETLASTITELGVLKEKVAELSKMKESLVSREAESGVRLEEKRKKVEELKKRREEVKREREEGEKNHEKEMDEIKTKYLPQIENLKKRKVDLSCEWLAIKKKISEREMCMALRKEMEGEGIVERMDLNEEIEGIKKEMDEMREKIESAKAAAEHYRVVTVTLIAEADELHASTKVIREAETKVVHEKDALASHFEVEVLNLRKQIEEEKKQKEDRIAQETKRLLEKAKEDKERKEKEEKRRVEKEKEKKRKKEEEDMKKKHKEEEEKKRRMKAEEQEMKKKQKEEEERRRQKKMEDEKKNRVIDALQNKDVTHSLVSRVQQRRQQMEAAAARPFDTPALSRAPLSQPPPPIHVHPPSFSSRHSQMPKKSLFVCDDESSDDDDVNEDFFMEDRVMAQVPAKYAGSPPKINRNSTPVNVNPFELSFADVQSSTPRQMHSMINTFDVSFNNVATSTPQPKAGKSKKATRGRKRK